mmetsp:Transcript_21735/g.43622  ORF Transcript_21735/g.43622 Transcript_21735/m.43622 type:complete len:99 (-) Transcript_21735:929-1225(-)
MADGREAPPQAFCLRGHKAPVLCLAAGPLSTKNKDKDKPRDLILSGSDDCTARLWDLRTRKRSKPSVCCSWDIRLRFRSSERIHTSHESRKEVGFQQG